MKRILLIIAALSLAACAGPAPKSSGKTELWWLGQAAVRITTPGGKVIVIDPWITSNPKTPPQFKNLDVLGKVDLILVTHGHFNVNGRRTDVPSMILEAGDAVDVRPGSQARPYFRDLKAADESVMVPLWLARDLHTLSGKVNKLPERAEIDAKLNEQLIVEYYSR